MRTRISLILTVLPSVALAYTKDSVMVPMRDGTRLNTNIYKPTDTNDFPLPVILIRTPYGADGIDNDPWGIFYITDVKRYILVVQDTRGRFESEGRDSVFLDDGWRDGKQDGYDCIEWIAGQTWCNGKIGTYGGSALGITQYMASGAVPPHFTCGLPVMAAWDFYRHAAVIGGEYRQYDCDGWLSGQGSLYMRDYWFSHPDKDTAWAWLDVSGRKEMINVPFLHIGGWYDMFSEATCEAFCDLQYYGANGARGKQKLIMGPWSHGSFGSNQVGEITFPQNAIISLDTIAWPWFDYWLKGTGTIQGPAVRYYLMGPVDTAGYWNSWRDSDTWPVPSYPAILYLRENGRLSLEPPGSEAPETYTYDPRDPVPTVGGTNLILPQGPRHQPDSVWMRPDVLLYETEPLVSDAIITGNIWLRLYASSDRYDTDFTGKLVDIYPDGRRMLIADGILMARHRLGYDTSALLTPGEVYELRIDLWPTAYVFPAGHRIGLAVSSSNWPRFRANPNVPEPLGQETDTLIAHNTVYHDAAHPSALLLPVVNGWGVGESAGKSGFQLILSPNPFRTTCEASFFLAEAGEVSLKVYDISGRLVESLLSGKYPAGRNTVSFGENLGPGVYHIVLTARNKRLAERVIKFR
ncbi:MAG: CocE/NonD family hydrolase [candidate division WOR-3 bacterium]